MDKVLHFLPDEKIANRIIKIFEEALPGKNLFLVTSRCKQYTYVQTGPCIIRLKEFQNMSDMARWNTVKYVVIHNLTHCALNVADKCIPKGMPTYWVIWGMDLYNVLLAPKGFPLYDNDNPFKSNLNTRWKNIWASMKARRVRKFVEKKVTHIMTDTTDNDYQMLVQYYPEMASKQHVPFFYYPIDELLGPLVDQSVNTGRESNVYGGIQVGNSCSPTNNHLYAFKILSTFDLHNRPICVPLSYSIREYYRKPVLEGGQQFFGDQFHPVLDFMPLEDYSRMMCNNTVVVYANFRQEAIGNILTSLYLGAKVFLSKYSPVHEWARSIGVELFVLEEMTQESLDTPLSSAKQRVHRERLMELYNTNRMIEIIRTCFTETVKSPVSNLQL